MKPVVAFIAVLTLTTFSSANERYINIGELKMFVAYEPTESPNQIREYLPKGESLEHWSHLASVRTFGQLKNPNAYLLEVAHEAKKSSPAARYQFYRDVDTKMVVLDFLTFSPHSSRERFAEWNLMRATYVEGKGLVVYQYAMRFYSIGSESAKQIIEERRKMMDPFTAASFEEQDQPNQIPEPTPGGVAHR